MENHDIATMLLSVANNTLARIHQIPIVERSDEEKELYAAVSTYLTKVYVKYGSIFS